MYFVDAVKVLLRRWYVVLIGAVVTIAAGAAALLMVPTEYQSSGQLLLLLPPEAAGESTPTNPLLNLQEGLVVTATLIASNVTSSDAQKALFQAGYTAEYSVSLSPGAGPLLVITSSGTDPATVEATRDEVVSRVTADLANVQNDPGIPARLVIHAKELNVTAAPEVLPGSKIRALAVIAAVGVVATLIVAFTLDKALLKRKQQSEGEGPDNTRTVLEPGTRPLRLARGNPTPRVSMPQAVGSGRSASHPEVNGERAP